MEQKEWITTEQMLYALKNDPDNEQEYSLNLGGKVLRSTHWFVYDLEKRMFGHTRDWPYDWFSETEILEQFFDGIFEDNVYEMAHYRLKMRIFATDNRQNEYVRSNYR